MKKTTIHQFHPGSAYGDAVTNGMFLIRRMLRGFGFVSEIYVQQVAPELKGLLHFYKKLKLKGDDVILIHHSMGHELADWVLHLPGKKILVYHNITPAEFFPEESPLRYYSRLGREQLKAYLPVMQSAIANSRFNADELLDIGYKDVEEIPLLIDINKIQNQKWDESIVLASSETYTILFVGRIVPNKCQEDLIKIAWYLKGMIKRPFQLILVGCYDEADPYYRKLSAQIESAGLSDYIRFTGKIPEVELYGWYRAADVFLCMSEHEGFCVPLIEAMAFDVPVIAFKSSNIPHTMGGAGIMVTKKDHVSIAALIKILSEDRAMKRAIVRGQRSHVCKFTQKELSSRLYAFLKEQEIKIPEPLCPEPLCPEPLCPEPLCFDPCATSNRLDYQVEGPFESSYSLALVNRETAFALNRNAPGSVGLFATEGPGDYEPDMDAVRSIPGLKEILEKGRKGSRADVVIRNLYPPRVSDMDGQINLLYFAWEESMLPVSWIEQFNQNLDGLPVLSGFIKKVLIDNGVSLPVMAAGCGIDHIHRSTVKPYPLKVKKGFKFLHISSCFPRKGVDLLLQAFAETFTKKEDVSLIIKTFPNIHNTIEAQVEELKKGFPECPLIEIINQDLSAGEIADLYNQCDALVAPSRGEGFGLPMAEAMWYGFPVITTAYGGQSDFCTDRTSWLIDFSFQPAQTHISTHMELFNSVWMEPDVKHLGKLMYEVRHATGEQLQPRLDAAKKLMETQFSWDRCADRLKELEQQIFQTKPLSRKKHRLGWISSWNSKCGIAVYSRFLVNSLGKDDFDIRILASMSDTTVKPDESDVLRCWTDCCGAVDELLALLAKEKLDVLVVQFNFSFFSSENLERIIRFTNDRGIVSIIFFHSTADVDLSGFKVSLRPIGKTLAMADRLLVHSLEDLNRFKSWGVYENVAIFPHGVLDRSPEPLDKAKKRAGIPAEKIVIASYGFILPHKGLEQLIKAFAMLQKQHSNLYLFMVNALYPTDVSTETKLRCENLIKENSLNNSVTLFTEFLEDEESFALLDASTLIVFPCQDTAESASGAIRYGLATRRPVVCTPLKIFTDVSDIVHRLPGTSPEDIAAGIEHLLHSPDLLNSKQEIQNRWLAAHSWNILGNRLGGMIKGLINNLS